MMTRKQIAIFKSKLHEGKKPKLPKSYRFALYCSLWYNEEVGRMPIVIHLIELGLMNNSGEMTDLAREYTKRLISGFNSNTWQGK